MRTFEQIAKYYAEDVVAAAETAGYEVKGRRAVFFQSDIRDLREAIHQWLDEHMREPTP